jgi:hypothetical protein
MKLPLLLATWCAMLAGSSVLSVSAFTYVFIETPGGLPVNQYEARTSFGYGASLPTYAAADFNLLKVLEVKPQATTSSAALGARAPAVEPATPVAAPAPIRPIFSIGGSGLNIRSTPSRDGLKLFALPPGTRVSAVATVGNWTEIETADGRRGFAFTRYLDPVTEVASR